jgi:hypothetical protein
LIVLGGCAARYTQFGDPPKRPVQEPFTVQHVLAKADQLSGQWVKVAGVVSDLCTHAGCWMEIADRPGTRPLFVKFTYDTSTARVPAEAKGHRAVVEGRLVISEMPEAQRRHIARDQGATPEQLATIQGPERVVRLECPTAGIEGVQPASPQTCEHG